MEKREFTINTRDCMKYIFNKWKKILIVGIIFGAIFGVATLGYYVLQKQKESGVNEEQLQQYNEDYAEYQTTYNAKKSDYEVTNARAEAQYNYLINSIYIQLDAKNVLVNTMDVAVSFSEEMPEQNIKTYVALCAAGLDSMVDWDDLGSQVSREGKYIRELVEAEVDNESNIIHIIVKYPEQNFAEMILDAIEDDMSSYSKDYNYLGKAELHFVNKSSYYTVDNNVIDVRDKENGLYSKYKNEASLLEEELDSMEAPALPSGNVVVRSKVIKMVLLIAIIGGILGVIATCYYFYLRFVNKGIIYSAEEYRRITEKDVLGVLGSDAEEHEKVYKEIGIKLKSHENIKRLILFSDLEQTELTTIKKSLSKYAKDFDILPLSMKDQDKVIETLYSVQAACLVVKREETMLPEVVKMVDMVKEADKKLLGSIVL